MCIFISFFHKPGQDEMPNISVWDLNSHSDTSTHLKLNCNLWQEGHYLPNGEIELRYNDSFNLDKKEYESNFKTLYPTFIS